MNNLILIKLIAFVSLFLLSCEKKVDYCSVYANKEASPKEEVFFLQDSVKVSFINYWKNIDSLKFNTSDFMNYVFESFNDFQKYNSFYFRLSKQSSIEYFEQSLFSTFLVEGILIDKDISKEITKTINDVDYKILFLDNNTEISLKSYGKYSNDFILYISTEFYNPFPKSLSQIENKKQELVDDLLNRLYCVLSTLEIEVQENSN